MEFLSLKSIVLFSGFTIIAIVAFLVGVWLGRKTEREKNE